MTQLRQHEDDLRGRDIDVAIVTFDEDVMARAYAGESDLPWPLLIDSDHSVYTSFGMGRATWWSIYSPVSVWSYLKLILFRHRWPRKPGSDDRQLGGDVLIDPGGIIRLHHASTTPHDRPTVPQLLAFASAS